MNYLIRILYLLLILLSANVFAASYDSHSYVEDALQKQSVRTELEMLDDSSFGDEISVGFGHLSMAMTDVSIPGNSVIPVEFRRKFDGNQFSKNKPLYEMEQWRIDLPHITTKLAYFDVGSVVSYVGSWGTGQECSGKKSPGMPIVGVVQFKPYQFWAGMSLYVPNKVNELILDNQSDLVSSTKYPSITKSNWLVTCAANNNGGERFIVKSPEGLTYTFSQKKLIPALSVLGVKKTNYEALYRYDAYMYVTKIEDLYGNYVDYNYDANSNLISIVSNDNREINVEYNSDGKVSTVTANGKQWKYLYTEQTGKLSKYTFNALSKVVLPDNSAWEYNIVDVAHFSNPTNPTIYVQNIPSLRIEGTVKHPNGALATYYLEPKGFCRSNIPFDGSLELAAYKDANKCQSVYAIIEKTISGPGLNNDLIWKYDYSQNYTDGNRSWNDIPANELPPGIDNVNYKRTTIFSPDNKKTIYYFNRDYSSYLEGQVIVKEIRDTTNDLLFNRVTSKFIKGGHIGHDDVFNINQNVPTNNINVTEYRQLLQDVKEENFNQGDSVYDVYQISYYDYSKYGYYSEKSESNYFSNYKLLTKVNHYDDINNWVIGLPSSISQSKDNVNWFDKIKYDYYDVSPAAKVKNIWINGKLSLSYSYDANGNLYQKSYNGSNLYKRYENYYRGIPQKITMPCGSLNGCNTVNGSTTNTVISLQGVSSEGWISSLTDFNGNKTFYRYNPIGWLTKIGYTDTKWLNKTIDYTTVTVANDGLSGSNIPVGSLRQMITQGNYQKRIYHDGLLRPIFVSEQDITNGTTARYQSFEYDAENRETLGTFINNSSANKFGNETEYDVLGRAIRKTRTSDGREIQTSYLSNNSVAVTDGEGNTTTTTYLAYGSPDYQLPISIDAPDTDNLSIAYNEFGQITSITQGDVTENRVYDAYQELCKVVRPETGITAFGYNSQRQVIWRAEGTSGSATACDPGAVPSSEKVLIGYDNQGLIRTETYPDGISNKTFSYDPQGNLLTLAAGNVLWNYQYNSLNLVAKETLTLDNRSFALTRDYNSLGALSSLTYPSGETVNFLPNALGQATKAGIYASDVSYFANGQIKQFTYGNGILRTVQQDTSGRLASLLDAKSGVVKNNLKPAYDFNDNLTALVDFVDRSYDINNIHYDGVDRLISANGKWGTGSFSYDGLGNLLGRSYNSSTIGFQYNSRNLLNNLTGAYAYKYQYDARGNIINNGRYALSYNRAQQMTSAKSISYVYDGFNRKVKKTNSSGNSYTVYSKEGQLLYRLAPNGTKTDNIYLGKQLIAEVDGASEMSPGPEKTPPIVNISIKVMYTGGECSDRYCPMSINIKNYAIQWSSQYSTSCSGTITDSNLNKETISGLSGGRLLPATVSYTVNMTCIGPDGSTSKTAATESNLFTFK